MSGFFRPEAMATLRRWREALTGVAVGLVGAAIALAALTFVLFWIGLAVVALGAFLVFSGWQKGRFRRAATGPGIVALDEGRVTYMGPLDGGMADIEDLTALMLDTRSRPTVWILHRPGADPLHIPVSATGADRLFDAFLRLPGLNTGRMVRKLNNSRGETVLIWERVQGANGPRRLN